MWTAVVGSQKGWKYQCRLTTIHAVDVSFARSEWLLLLSHVLLIWLCSNCKRIAPYETMYSDRWVIPFYRKWRSDSNVKFLTKRWWDYHHLITAKGKNGNSTHTWHSSLQSHYQHIIGNFTSHEVNTFTANASLQLPVCDNRTAWRDQWRKSIMNVTTNMNEYNQHLKCGHILEKQPIQHLFKFLA